MANAQEKNEDAFDEIFASAVNIAEQITPEPVGKKSSEPKKKKVTGKSRLTRYMIYGMSGLFCLFIIFMIIIIALPSESSETPSVSVITELQENTPVLEPTTEQISEISSSDEPAQTSMVLENSDLKELIDKARESIQFRDQKYQELQTKYQKALNENNVLKNEIKSLQNGGANIHRSTSQGMKVMKGISIITIQEGYAFIQKAKGSAVYSVTVGENINGSQIKKIDPINREIITTTGVIR